MPKRRGSDRPTDQLAKWMQLGIAVIIFIGGMFTNAVSISKNIASVNYVDDQLVKTKSYVDTRVSDAIKQLQDYSDRNRLVIEKSMAEQTSLIREQGASIRNLELWMERLANRMNATIDAPSNHRKKD